MQFRFFSYMQIFQEFNRRFHKGCESRFNWFWTPDRVTATPA